MPLTITDSAGGTVTLRFGLDATATEGIDAALGESELPPFPPTGVFEARFIGNDIALPQLGQGINRDYRTGDGSFSGVKTHELFYQVGTGTTITISWNFPSGVAGLLQDLFGGVLVNQPMSGAGNYSVSNPGAINKLKMIVTYTGVPQESLALTSPNGGELWAKCSTQKIKWAAAGFAKVKVEFSSNNGANWSTLTDTATAALGGYSWVVTNMLSAQCLVRVSDASDDAPNDVSAAAFAIVNASEAPVDLPITISDLAGGTQALRVGVYPSATNGIDPALGESELPPSPPSGIFDARLVGDDIGMPQLGQGLVKDYRAGSAEFSGAKIYEVKYQVGTGTSIKISWDLPSNVTGVLQDVITGTLINQPMTGLGNFTISNPGAFNKLKMTMTYMATPTSPAAPSLVSPSDGAVNIPTNPILSWNASTGADTYQLQVSASSTFTTTAVDQSNITATSFQASGLQNNTQYFWRVNAKNACGTSAFSSARSFTTAVVPLVPPTLVSPADKATGVATNPLFSWNASADSFRIQVSTSADFSTTLLDRRGLRQTNHAAIGLRINTKHYWRVNATNAGGTSDWSTVWSFMTGVVSVTERSSEPPAKFELSQNYPNPFNPGTTIQFAIPVAAHVTLTIYNTAGQRIQTLVQENFVPGQYQVEWDASGMRSGAYFYHLQAGKFRATKKLTLLK